MDQASKPSRPVRNRRHSRRAWPPGDTHRPIKRLFTPEIKRMLKDWLVRRRENPYPTREEKKQLAQETGLTYTQICNWFANWRRKLKNSRREMAKKSWGNLIKNYNTNAKGNVEQFSICSNDSIWGDEHSSQISETDSFSDSNYEHNGERPNEQERFVSYQNFDNNNMPCPNKYYKESGGNRIYYAWPSQPQCFQISSTTDEKLSGTDDESLRYQSGMTSNPKYKQQIMEKYLRDTSQSDQPPSSPNPELSKWLESTANFTPNKNNYIDWSTARQRNDKNRPRIPPLDYTHSLTTIHQKEELDAAEALANLACNYRQRLLNSTA